jgi:hypothetical protein
MYKTTYHIRRDGRWLCNNTLNSSMVKGYSYAPEISFSDAHKKNLKFGCCEKCQKRYYEILDKLKKPIIIK